MDLLIARKRLLEILVKESFQYSETALFKLVSGKMSQFYINCKKTTYNAEAMNLIGEILFEKVSRLNVDGIGGLTLGADPIAFSVSMISFQKGRPIDSFVIRKKPKEHGLKNSIEGNLEKIHKVVIIEDVVTTGQSTVEAITRAKEANLEIVKVISLVDREEGGKEEILKWVLNFEAIFTKSELFSCYSSKKIPVK
ncbi:MAG: orotate phosphoribosyltransferase [Nitrospirae bacterium]|nr:orotate phosphoribosyltransferase [Nitrospirota bacterium]MBI3351852.1 orotate phosphoribosyltransferase [Nitrospirota bacterium]